MYRMYVCARARSKPYTPVGLRTRLGFSAIARLPFKRRAVAIGRPPLRFSGQQWGCHHGVAPPPMALDRDALCTGALSGARASTRPDRIIPTRGPG